ncbi:ribosomal RNA large subunit methyltransferase E [Tanacetum coccineum]
MNSLGTVDFFYKEAQRLGYVARSAFKLLQIQKQYKLIKPGSSVIDLGCAPGAWLEVSLLSSLVNGQVFTDWVTPVVLKAYQ